MPVAKTARLRAKPGSAELVKQAAQEYVALVKQHEPGTLFYAVVQEKEDPTVFLFFRISADGEAAFDQHDKAPYIQKYVDIFNGESIEPLFGIDYTFVASNWIA